MKRGRPPKDGPPTLTSKASEGGRRAPRFSQRVLDYFDSHAIDPAIAVEVGVTERDSKLVFPYTAPDGSTFERVRDLERQVTFQPKGQPLSLWRPNMNGAASAGMALVCEGESDLLAALTALRKAPLEYLRNLPVVGVPGTGYPAERLASELSNAGYREAWLAFDGDEAGRAYQVSKASSALRAASLRPIPVELPNGRDLADMLALATDRGEWIADTLTSAEAVAAAAPEPDLSAGWAERQPLELAVQREPDAPDYLVDGRIERGTVTVLSGDTGSAKSFAALDLAVRVANGAQDWLDRKLTGRHGRVVVIDEENPKRLVRSRARALGLTAETQGRVRYFHRLGVQLGAEDADWTEWLRYELKREPADLLVIDTGIAATAPEINDNDQVAALYVRHLRPLAADLSVAIVLLLHERKPQEGARANRSQATMGARSWIGQADAQLTLRPSGAGEERQLEDGGYAYEKTFTLEVGKLRDGGGEIAEALRISSTLDGNRTLLRAEIVNEGLVRSDDARCAELAEAVADLLTDGQQWSKSKLAADLAVNAGDRTFTRALSKGVKAGTFARPKRGTYALEEVADG